MIDWSVCPDPFNDLVIGYWFIQEWSDWLNKYFIVFSFPRSDDDDDDGGMGEFFMQGEDDDDDDDDEEEDGIPLSGSGEEVFTYE